MRLRRVFDGTETLLYPGACHEVLVPSGRSSWAMKQERSYDYQAELPDSLLVDVHGLVRGR